MPATAPLADALKKNLQATEEIKSAADDLAVVHAVLDKELSEEAVTEDAAQAVAQAQQIEKRLSRSAKRLDGVNRALRRAVAS